MKNIFLLLCTAVLFASCDKNDDNNNTSTITTAAVTATVTSGSWRVTYYWDTDHEETASFNGYAFVFGAGGTVTASKTGSVVTGTWATGTDDSKVKLVIAFTTPPDFAELSEDWQVIERSDTRIALRHVSGGGGGTDYLTFQKN